MKPTQYTISYRPHTQYIYKQILGISGSKEVLRIGRSIWDRAHIFNMLVHICLLTMSTIFASIRIVVYVIAYVNHVMD
jgi:hypothetical protein